MAGFWGSFASSSGSTFGNSAAGSIGSSFGATMKGLGNAWNLPIASAWAKWQEDEDDYNDQRALANADSLGALSLKYNLESLRSSPLALRQGLEAAGINPILAFSSGAGSSAASPQLNPFTGESSLPKFAKGDSASAYMLQREREEQIKETTVNLKEQNKNLHAQNDKLKAEAANIAANTAHTLKKTSLDGYEQGGLFLPKNVLKQIGDVFDLSAHSMADGINSANRKKEFDKELKKVVDDVIDETKRYRKPNRFGYPGSSLPLSDNK